MWISRSTFLEREELRRDPFPLSRGQNENTGVPSPRYLVMASHYLSGQQPRESVLVTTVVFLERKASSKPAVRIYIYIYLYSSFFRINRLVKENIRDEGRRERERGLRYFQETIPRKKNSKTRKRRYRERQRERRGIIIKMREISKILDLRRNEDGQPGDKGKPTYESSLPKFRRVVEFLYISTFALSLPLSILGKAKFSYFIFQRIASISHVAPTPSLIYILSRVFSFIRHVSQDPAFSPPEQYVRFAAGVFNTLIYPPVARTHRFPSRR